MRLAEYKDKGLVVSILMTSFKNDPHVNFLLEFSKNKNKLKAIMEYVFEESLNKGEIYINDNNTAVVLWNTKSSEPVNLSFIFRNLLFLFRNGISTTRRVLKMDKLIHEKHPSDGNFVHLYLIGVLPEYQGNGYARQLVQLMIDKHKNTGKLMCLETSNLRNIEIYKKMGFEISNTVIHNDHKIFCMNRKL